MIIHDVEQGSPEWYRLRAGIPTASRFHEIMTPKKMVLSESRHKYACRLVAERLLNWQADSLDFLEHVQAGKEREPQAIRQLEFVHEIKVRTVGFVTSDDGRWGASPDRLIVGSLRPVEVKSPSDPVHLQYLLLGFEDAYRCQVQGQIMTMDSDDSLFYSFHPRMPECLVMTPRDESFISKLGDCLERFCDDLDALTERAKRLGAFQAYQTLTPTDVERSGSADIMDWVA